jgi:aromatic ring-cleaving dioxygenase
MIEVAAPGYEARVFFGAEEAACFANLLRRIGEPVTVRLLLAGEGRILPYLPEEVPEEA